MECLAGNRVTHLRSICPAEPFSHILLTAAHCDILMDFQPTGLEGYCIIPPPPGLTVPSPNYIPTMNSGEAQQFFPAAVPTVLTDDELALIANSTVADLMCMYPENIVPFALFVQHTLLSQRAAASSVTRTLEIEDPVLRRAARDELRTAKQLAIYAKMTDEVQQRAPSSPFEAPAPQAPKTPQKRNSVAPVFVRLTPETVSTIIAKVRAGKGHGGLTLEEGDAIARPNMIDFRTLFPPDVRPVLMRVRRMAQGRINSRCSRYRILGKIQPKGAKAKKSKKTK